MKVKHNEEAPRLLRSIRESSLKKRRVLSHLEKFPWARALRTRAVLRSGEVLSLTPQCQQELRPRPELSISPQDPIQLLL